MKLHSIGMTLGILLLSLATAFGQLALPDFSFSDLEGNTFRASDLDQNESVLIMYFDPWCEHCNQQAEWIAERADAFRDIQVVFVSFEPELQTLKDFRSRHFSQGNWPNLYFLQDKDFQFENWFGYTDDPLYIYCFKPNGRPGKYFGEEQRPEVLLNFL